MELREGPQTPYEVWCHHCHVTFAAGTRSCVHCGQRLSGPGPAQGATGALLEVPAEVGAAEASPLRRLGGMSLWVLIAVGAALSRMCEGG